MLSLFRLDSISDALVERIKAKSTGEPTIKKLLAEVKKCWYHLAQGKDP